MLGWTARWSPRTSSSPTLAASSAAAIPPRSSLLPLTTRVLAARGLIDTDAAARFLDPRLTHLHNPSLIPDLDKAAARLLDAARAREPITIYGDYDVDGITATSILFHTLKTLEPDADVRTYVPHRLDEGYGLNSDAIASIAHDMRQTSRAFNHRGGDAGGESGGVIVSVDCGVTAVEPARTARSLNVDLIITDHHNPPARVEDLPDAYAVVHPRHPLSQYPFHDLCGAGVAYKLAWRLATMHNGSERVAPHIRELLVDLLAFTALGVIADIVPLVDENRVIARFGLSRVASSRFIGLRALVEASGLSQAKIGEFDAGFRLGPRLNAAGRMGHAKEAVELFTTATPDRAAEIARSLCELNDQRRAVEREIFDLAVSLAQEQGMTNPDRRAIVLAHESWHAGVVGIVCSRLVERFSRPTILMQTRDGVCHGSGRSVSSFNMHSALHQCAHLLEKFGGHDMAAGVHVRSENLAAFADAFVACANDHLTPDDLTPRLAFDCEADAAELTPLAVAQLATLAPFGRDNPEVRLLLRNLTIAAPPRPIGREGKHLVVPIRAAGSTAASSPVLRAVAWNWGSSGADLTRINRLREGLHIDAVVEPKISTFSGVATVEPVLKDIATAT